MRKFFAGFLLLSLAVGASAKTTTSGHISVIDIQSDGTAAIALDSCGVASCFVPACYNGTSFVVAKHDVLYAAFMSARVTERTVTITYNEKKPDAFGHCPLINLIVR